VKKEILLELYQIQSEINAISVLDPAAPLNDTRRYNISSLCFTPIPSKGCMVQSPLEYFQNDFALLSNTHDVSKTLYDCV